MPITTEYKAKWPTEPVHMLAEEQNLIPLPVGRTWLIHSPASGPVNTQPMPCKLTSNKLPSIKFSRMFSATRNTTFLYSVHSTVTQYIMHTIYHNIYQSLFPYVTMTNPLNKRMNTVGDKTVRNTSTFSIITHVLHVGIPLQHIIMPQQPSISYWFLTKENWTLKTENCLLGHDTALLD